ncbi:glycosyltransferase [Pseudogemmobacter bohemicus]|uniref:glycosyltransferase n=1 Tax=Pseudogemmobacter bohemicus TaxID=2250708 RepID=UPI000DD45BDC|nr:glycosyltransferase [Pseudogemmobacter bohemicus]
MPAELFDTDYYCRQLGRKLAPEQAWQHFQSQGDAVGFDPSPYFSTRFYKARHRNWNKRGGTAFEDFLSRIAQGRLRQSHPLIVPEEYSAASPDLTGLGAEAVLHFFRYGDGEGRSPSSGFDAGFYRRCYLPLGQMHAFRHYVTAGAALGHLPRALPRDAAASCEAMARVLAGLPRPILLVTHDAQQAGVPILTLDLARALRARGFDPVCLLANAGPLLETFRAAGPVFIMAEGWDLAGFAAAMPPCMPVLVNTAAAAEMVIPLAKAGLDCLLMIHEMPDYIRDQSLMPHLRAAHAAGAGLVASMPGMARELAAAIGGEITQLRPGIRLPPTSLAAFRRLHAWRRSGSGPVFVGAGHADRRKGFDLFLDAARRIAGARPDARFVWLGALDDWAQALAREALAGGMALTLPGFVADSLAWYRVADAYLLTSRQDPGPTTAIHAAAMGTPFVGYAADIGLIGLTEGVGQFVPPADETGFVAAALARADAVTAGTRRTLRRHTRREAGFDAYVSAILARFGQRSDGAA